MSSWLADRGPGVLGRGFLVKGPAGRGHGVWKHPEHPGTPGLWAGQQLEGQGQPVPCCPTQGSAHPDLTVIPSPADQPLTVPGEEDNGILCEALVLAKVGKLLLQLSPWGLSAAWRVERSQPWCGSPLPCPTLCLANPTLGSPLGSGVSSLLTPCQASPGVPAWEPGGWGTYCRVWPCGSPGQGPWCPG